MLTVTLTCFAWLGGGMEKRIVNIRLDETYDAIKLLDLKTACTLGLNKISLGRIPVWETYVEGKYGTKQKLCKCSQPIL